MQIKHKIWVWSSLYVHNGGEWLYEGPFEQYIQKYVSSQLLCGVLLFLLIFFLFFVSLSEKMGSSLDMSRFLSSSCQHVVKRILAYTLLDASYPFLLFFCCGCRHSINIVFAWKMKSHSISNSSILNNHNLKWRPNWNYAKFNQSTTCRKIHIFQSYLSHNEISHHVNSPYPLQPSPPCQPCTL